MTAYPKVAALFLPHGLRVGHVHLSVYGLCAAAGVVLAMAVAARTAKRLHLDPESAWDAGFFALLSCFVSSRLLLVLRDPRAFLRFPLLVLSLPSLTLGGMLLAGLATAFYLRRKRVPVLRLMDAFAAPGALLAAFLEAGHSADGSEPGMPLARPWAAQTASGGTPQHPVALYGVAAALLLAAVLWIRSEPRRPAGQTAALALFSGGFLAFALDMLSLPIETGTDSWLEWGQYIALAAMLAGALLLTLRTRPARVATDVPAAELADQGAEGSPAEVSPGPSLPCNLSSNHIPEVH